MADLFIFIMKLPLLLMEGCAGCITSIIALLVIVLFIVFLVVFGPSILQFGM